METNRPKDQCQSMDYGYPEMPRATFANSSKLLSELMNLDELWEVHDKLTEFLETNLKMFKHLLGAVSLPGETWCEINKMLNFIDVIATSDHFNNTELQLKGVVTCLGFLRTYFMFGFKHSFTSSQVNTVHLNT